MMLKITYTPDEDIWFYYFGDEEMGLDYAIEANKNAGYYSTPEENAEVENPENYVGEELYHREILREIAILVNGGYTAHYNGAILTVTNY